MNLTTNAKYLRRNMTDAERKLWYYLRGHRFLGYKFKRQKPIGRYIVDFVCLEKALIIEIDGGQHLEQRHKDDERDHYFRRRGFQTLRFWNHDVLRETETVLEHIRHALQNRAATMPQPPPKSGRRLRSAMAKNPGFNTEEPWL